MPTAIVLDFETLSLKENAVLLALGAVAVNTATGETISEFYAAIDPRQQPTRDIDAGTVLWWLGQDKAAQAKITEAVSKADQLAEIDDSYSEDKINVLYAEAAHRIDHVAQAFVAWVNHLPAFDGCWSNGAVDHGWLASMMEYSGLKNPIPYWKQRDYRTLKALFPAIKAAELDGAVNHHALWDAKYQAAHLVKLLQHANPVNAIGPDYEDGPEFAGWEHRSGGSTLDTEDADALAAQLDGRNAEQQAAEQAHG